MLIINPLKPFYVDEKNRIIRMGNFKDSGKEIVYESNEVFDIFNYLKTPIEKEELINRIHEKNKTDKTEINFAIEYLMKEKFIIDNGTYEKILANKTYNRQNLYFSMFNSNYMFLSKSDSQKKLLILGLGGVGANVSLILSRAGFKNFTLVDCDKVEKSNLIRQLPYDENDIGLLKTDCLANKIFSEECIIEKKNIIITNEEDIKDEVKKADFVLCTLDKPSRVIRRLINNICVNEKKPVLFAGFSEHVAMVGPFIVPNSACLVCNEKELSEIPMNNVKITPSYGPLCMFISSIISNEIINYFVKFNPNNLIGKTLMFNFANYNIDIIKWEKRRKCKVCGLYDSK